MRSEHDGFFSAWQLGNIEGCVDAAGIWIQPIVANHTVATILVYGCRVPFPC
jgi:hypothetical protein